MIFLCDFKKCVYINEQDDELIKVKEIFPLCPPRKK